MPGRPLLLFMFMSSCICLLLFGDLGRPSSLLSDRIINFGHVPLFAVVAGMVLWVRDRKDWIYTVWNNYLWAFVLLAALALATETIQHFMPERSFQVGDIVNDLSGAGVFLLAAYQFRQGLQRWKQVGLGTASVVLLLAVCLPVVVAAADELRAWRDFPLLASFETRAEMERWKTGEDSSRRVMMHSTQGMYSLKAVLPPGLYPGITWDYPPGNWQGYDTLAFDAFLEGDKPVALTVRINDLVHNKQYHDRYNRTFTLVPGWNRLTIDLSDVEHAPEGRKMDMDSISLLCIYSYRLKEQRTVYFDNFRLEKKPS